MAQWKRRGRRHVPAGLNRYYSATGRMIRPEGSDEDGISRNGMGGVVVVGAALCDGAVSGNGDGDSGGSCDVAGDWAECATDAHATDQAADWRPVVG
jgi:hypothetical protein